MIPKRIQKQYNKLTRLTKDCLKKWGGILYGIFLIVISITIISLLSVFDNASLETIIKIPSLILMIFIFLLFIIGLPIFLFYLSRLFVKFFLLKINIFLHQNITEILNQINSLAGLINDQIYDVQSINDILKKISLIQLLLKKFNVLKWVFIFEGKLSKEIDTTLEETIKWILGIIHNLRSDLIIRLAEQQKLLKSAKGEVEKHIQGTTELNQVSELQKQRLDKQIEQFEELQRVLVKV